MELKDVIHFYLGCEIMFVGKVDRTFIKNGERRMLKIDNAFVFVREPEVWKLILRPLSELSHELARQMPDSSMHVTPHGIFYSPENR